MNMVKSSFSVGIKDVLGCLSKRQIKFLKAGLLAFIVLSIFSLDSTKYFNPVFLVINFAVVFKGCFLVVLFFLDDESYYERRAELVFNIIAGTSSALFLFESPEVWGTTFATFVLFL